MCWEPNCNIYYNTPKSRTGSIHNHRLQVNMSLHELILLGNYNINLNLSRGPIFGRSLARDRYERLRRAQCCINR